MKASQYLADFFVENGITDCFMVTGGGAMHLDDALGHKEGMHCTFNHHEQACAIAAEAYCRMTGRIALVCVTSGPGGLNTLTGVMGGWTDSIPMVIVSGQVKRETMISSCQELGLRQLGDQETDIVAAVSPMTKYAVTVYDPDEIAFHLEKALYLATHGRGGPVWLDIPLDVQGANIDESKLKHFSPDSPDIVSENSRILKKEEIRECAHAVLQKIADSRAPLILAGTGIRLGKAENEFMQLVEKLHIPVVTAWNANDTLSPDSSYFAGMPGTVGTRPGNFAVQNADFLLSLACRMNIRMVGYNRLDFAQNAYKAVVDIDDRELAKPTLKADLPICCDVKDFICALLDELNSEGAEDGLLQRLANPDSHREWLIWCQELNQKYPPVMPQYHGTKMLNPYVFIDTLFSCLDSTDRIICGNGSACVITFQAGHIKQGQRMFSNSGCAAMGYGLPASVGVAVSDNSRRTICIDGDGSFMMNLQELATIAYNRLNIKIFILNNSGYHSIRQTQRNMFKSSLVGVDSKSGLCFPDFGILAKAFGIDYLRIDNEKDCAATVMQALQSGKACIVEVILDPEQPFAPKSSSKVLPDGRIVSPTLDDMAPFLSREEYGAARF